MPSLVRDCPSCGPFVSTQGFRNKKGAAKPHVARQHWHVRVQGFGFRVQSLGLGFGGFRGTSASSHPAESLELPELMQVPGVFGCFQKVLYSPLNPEA